MKKLLNLLLSAVILIAVSCSESYDDSLIWEKLNDHENRITKLEEICKQMNTNITSLQTIVEALQDNDYVTNIAPIMMDGKVVGYTIIFSKSGAVTIYHGKDGKDGHTPVIGIVQDTDGVYYWTLDGDWLLDKDGNKINAEGIDGLDGITPKLKIEDGYWYISYDNGTSWTQLGKATGENGDSMFTDVTYDDNFVYLTLTNGSQLMIPRRTIQNNEIWYTSSNANIITPNNTNIFGANIISNEYKNGLGIIIFDKDIIKIGNDAFSKCHNLKSITIPNSVTEIGNNAFNKCSNLKSVTIPDSMTSIGNSAFNDCTSLTSITIPDGVTEIGNWTFDNCINLKSITIPNSVTEIGSGAFSWCNSLTNITIPDNVNLIEDYTFVRCSNLISITIPNGVTEIGQDAFQNCIKLTSITIPDSVTEIREYAFYGCSSLTSVYCKATPPPTGSSEMFNGNASGRKIYVPTASVDAYKTAAGWSNYADAIEGYDF